MAYFCHDPSTQDKKQLRPRPLDKSTDQDATLRTKKLIMHC